MGPKYYKIISIKLYHRQLVWWMQAAGPAGACMADVMGASVAGVGDVSMAGEAGAALLRNVAKLPLSCGSGGARRSPRYSICRLRSRRGAVVAVL